MEEAFKFIKSEARQDIQADIFIANVLKFAHEQQNVGNAGQNKWDKFCASNLINQQETGLTFENAKRFSAAYQTISKQEGFYTGREFVDNSRTDKQIGARLKRIPSALHQEIITQLR